MITAQHQSLLAETLKSMTPLELESLLEEIAPHFKKERLVPILKKSFDFQGYEEDIEDLKSQIDELEDEASSQRSLIEEIGMICCNVKETDSAETLWECIGEITYKVS